MNRSIYLMLFVPYTALGIMGFLIYRGMKKNEEFLAKSQPPIQTPPTDASGSGESP